MDGQDDMLSGCVCMCVSEVLPVLSPVELVNNDPASGVQLYVVTLDD